MPGKPTDDQREGEAPSIPDGGLSTSMPDWLRRPPAWRTLPDREVAPVTSEPTTSLPEADTSEIDPRTFIHDDDLPMWLRSLRRPATASAAPPGMAAVAVVPTDAAPPDPPEPVIVGETEEEVQSDARSSAFQPRHPSVLEAESAGEDESLPESEPGTDPVSRGSESPWWASTGFVVVFGMVVLIALAVVATVYM